MTKNNGQHRTSIPASDQHSLKSSQSGFYLVLLLMTLTLLQACTSVNTFPTIARPGDTMSVMVGGSEDARKDTISASLTDNNGVVWDLKALGNIRSVFNLRPDGRSYGLIYGDFLGISETWKEGHEPTQTVLVFDVPDSAAIGPASLSVNLNVTDDSSGVAQPATIALEIVDVPGGVSDDFLRQDFSGTQFAVNFADLEPAPHAKISFGDRDFSATTENIGAVELIIDFDENIVSGDDIYVYVAPHTTQRGSLTNTGKFGGKQRMFYWKQDGSQLYITVLAPKSVAGKFIQIYVTHPKGLSGDPGLNLVSTVGYDIDGNTITATPQFTYHP